MVNSPKKDFSPLSAGRYGKLTIRSTRRRHQLNEGKSYFEADLIQALGALCSLRSKTQLAAERRQDTNLFKNKEKDKRLRDYVERETAVAKMRVEDAEIAIPQGLEDMRSAESGGLTSREPRQMIQQILDAIGDNLNDLASSDNEQDGEDDDDTEQGKLSEDDEPSWVMGTISETVQQRMERFQQKQMKLSKLTQLGWQDVANYFRQRDKKYGLTELKSPAVIKPHMDDNAAYPAPTTFVVFMEFFDIIPQIP
jgi:hypothetical protein